MTRAQLDQKEQEFLRLSQYSVLEAYAQAHKACRLTSDYAIPEPAVMQELVAAWKVL